ncbi:UPF0721 transmembrane protein [Bryobacterales bacterium F-183]|nr:UPF0721 transmembrane protein [Bryobacterales bacterium F-183]
MYWYRAEKGRIQWPSPIALTIGFIANFFDALGIGCFATITAAWRYFGLVRDEHIPGSLNAGVTIPAILEGLIYIAVIEVDMVTLVSMIAAAVVGAWLGADVVSGWSRRKIQIGLGTALLITAGFGLASKLGYLPGSGDLLGFTGVKLAIAVAINCMLGALTTLGIGFFAPCMIAVYLLGLDAKAAFPIMMGSVSFLGPVASVPFIRKGAYDMKAALSLTLGGVPGVLLAAFLVKSLPLETVRWGVLVIVVYTGLMTLRAARTRTA